MELKETTISSEKIYDGIIISVEKDTVRLPNGNTSVREVVRHPGGVCVCAVDADLNLFFVRQFRYPYQMEILELPAGKLDKEGEDVYKRQVNISCAVGQIFRDCRIDTQLLHIVECHESTDHNKRGVFHAVDAAGKAARDDG